MRRNEIVADASAILAALKNERFVKLSPERLVRASISAVNLSEVLAKLLADGLNETQANAAVTSLDLDVFPFDRRHAGVAAQLWAHTRQAGLSLGDRACLALGRILDCPVVTADRAWARVDVEVEIVLIR